MEFLTLTLFAICVLIVLIKPSKERLAWGLFMGATAICYIMFFFASWTSVLPFIAY
ncbi:hypothetical protein [Campylobacter sp. 19-13652]|uniref:hypothetical protein n=1 Tax=Campylobacter sp. 19-13652 TaxID=2840180 RepID=UPI001C76AC4C|nr:hypothetical protein [Campylobacter sp. 19-13652]BCX79547.1 hypothetical protein LBC_10090 [Campylobacter sp. 19-13652]